MNNKINHKVIGQINQQTAGPQADACVFLFFPNADFLITNKQSDSRVLLKNKPASNFSPSQKWQTYKTAQAKLYHKFCKRAIFVNAQVKTINI
jgi:hypothetical protein